MSKKGYGWLVLALAHAVWPPLIASSFAYMPQPFAWLSAIMHGATFIFVGLLGVYLLLPERKPFDALLPPLADRPEEIFRQSKTGRGGGRVIFSPKGKEAKVTGGFAEGRGRSLPSTFTTGGTEELSGEPFDEQVDQQ